MADEVRELSGKLGLDTTDFKTAIAAANRELRVLESGFRASAASLGDWSKDATGLENRIKSLTSQIDIQRSKVGALSAEYTRVAAEKGSTSRAAQDLEIKLNKETEILGKMDSELRTTQASLETIGSESDQAAQDTADLSKQEDKASQSTTTLNERLRNLSGGLSDAGTRIRSLAVGVAKAAAEIGVGLALALGAVTASLFALTLRVAASSDEIVENAEKIGITAEQYQIFKFIGDQVGTSVESIGQAFSKTTKAISEAQKHGSPMAKLFKDLGVSVTDTNGDLRDSESVFRDLIGAIGNIQNETQREIIAQQLFGKSYQELIPLVNAGKDGIASMTNEARRMGIVMNEDAVNAAANFNDQIGAIKAGISGLGARVAGAFIPLLSKLAKGFEDWLSSPAVRTGIDTLIRALTILGDAIGALLSGNLSDAFTKFGAFVAILSKLFGVSEGDANRFAINIIQTLQGVAKTIQGVFKGIGGSIGPIRNFITQLATVLGGFITQQLIPFIKDHGPAIKGALAGIGIAIAAVAVIIPVITALIAALTSPITLVIAAIALLSAAWATNWGGIQDKARAVWAFLQPILQSIWDWLSINIPRAIQILSDFWTNTLLPAIRQVGDFIQTQIIPVLQTIWGWLATNIPLALQTFSGFWTNTLLPAITAVWDWINTNLIPLFEALEELFNVALSVALTALAGLWEKVLQPALESVWRFIQENVLPIFADIVSFIEEKLQPILETVSKFIGEKVVGAFNGITSAIQGVITWVENLIEALKNIHLPDFLKPGSPTPFEIGLKGIAAATKSVTQAQKQMAAVLDDMKKTGESIGFNNVPIPQQSQGGLLPLTVNINVGSIRDEKDMTILARRIADEYWRGKR